MCRNLHSPCYTGELKGWRRGHKQQAALCRRVARVLSTHQYLFAATEQGAGGQVADSLEPPPLSLAFLSLACSLIRWRNVERFC